MSRTIQDPIPGSYQGDNQGTGAIEVEGPYLGTTRDVLHIEILTGGGIGNATFKYWLESDPTVESEPITIYRAIKIQYDLVIRFAVGNYVAGDQWTVELTPGTPLDKFYAWSFTTGTGSVVEPPSSKPSVSLVGASVDEQSEYVYETSPANRSGDIQTNLSEISITFTENIASIDKSLIQLLTNTVGSLNTRPTSPVSNNFNVNYSGRTLTVNPASDFDENTEVRLRILTGGVVLSNGAQPEYTLYFTTRFNPFLTTIDRIRLEASWANSVYDDTIARLIYKESVYVNQRFPEKSGDNLFNFLRSELVVCRVLRALSAYGVRSKRLGDFSVMYSDQQAANNCANDLERYLSFYMGQPEGFIKGWDDPNRPVFGRLWTEVGGSELPIGNSYFEYYRRKYKTGSPRN